jgi:hypothetical protein
MGTYAAMDCSYLIAGKLNILLKGENFLPEFVESCPRRINCRGKVSC